MKILLLHASKMEWKAVKEALRSAERGIPLEDSMEECIVSFTSVEEGDGEEEVMKAVESILEQGERVGTRNVVLYPWVHLTERPEKPGRALSLLKEMESLLRERGMNVKRAPFGWYKSFTISVKGHPLAELSRRF